MSTPTARIDQIATAERYDVVALASSAGGIRALGELLAALPADLPVPVLLVQHLDRTRQTTIAEVLDRRTEMVVKLAEHKEAVEPGVVYIAPPDHHLLITPDGSLALTSSEMVHFVRPSADLLFESVAGTYGRRAIACVLTGSGSDGSMGVTAVKSRGGIVIVQDPASAEFTGMPDAAIRSDAADLVLPLDEIAGVIVRLLKTGRS